MSCLILHGSFEAHNSCCHSPGEEIYLQLSRKIHKNDNIPLHPSPLVYKNFGPQQEAVDTMMVYYTLWIEVLYPYQPRFFSLPVFDAGAQPYDGHISLYGSCGIASGPLDVHDVFRPYGMYHYSKFALSNNGSIHRKDAHTNHSKFYVRAK
jgi:hypothetical protein